MQGLYVIWNPLSRENWRKSLCLGDLGGEIFFILFCSVAVREPGAIHIEETRPRSNPHTRIHKMGIL